MSEPLADPDFVAGADATATATSDPAYIEADLAATRTRLDNRIAELVARLSPGQLVDEALRYVQTSQGAEFTHNLSRTVREKPLPAALVGVGLAWLMASGAGPRRTERAERDARLRPTTFVYRPEWVTPDALDRDVSHAATRVTRQDSEADDAYAGRVDDARAKVLGLTRHAQETAEGFGRRIADTLADARRRVGERAQNMGERARDAAGRLSGAAHDAADRVRGTAQDAAGRLRGSAQDAAERLSGSAQDAANSWRSTMQDAADQLAGAGRQASDRMARNGQAAWAASGNVFASFGDNPLLLSALGLTAGALLGAILPLSEREESALGGVARQAREVVAGTAEEAIERGSRAAEQVLDAARQSASEKGLGGDTTVGELIDKATSGDLAESARQVAQDVLRAGEEAVKEALPKGGDGEKPAGGQSSAGQSQRPGAPG